MIKLQYLEKEDLRKIVEWNSDKSADYLLQWSGPAYSYPLTTEQVEDYFISNNSNISLYKILSVDTDFNYGAIKCYEHAGFVKEKFIENSRKSSSGYWNLYEMSISKIEWQRRNQ